MATVMAEQDGLYTLVAKHADGSREARVIGSIVDYLFAPDDPDLVVERLASPDTRIVSLTISEGGYNRDPASKQFVTSDPGVQHDLAHPESPRTAFGLVVGRPPAATGPRAGTVHGDVVRQPRRQRTHRSRQLHLLRPSARPRARRLGG